MQQRTWLLPWERVLSRLKKVAPWRIRTHQPPIPLSTQVWQRAVDSHSAWSACTFPRTSRFYNLYGKGYPTPYSLQYGAPGMRLVCGLLSRILHSHPAIPMDGLAATSLPFLSPSRRQLVVPRV